MELAIDYHLTVLYGYLPQAVTKMDLSNHFSAQQTTLNKEEEEDDIDYTKPWDYSDVIFIVEGQKVYANKMILSMSSPVMKAMFKADFREKDAKEIELPGKTLDVFLDLMKAVHPPHQFKGEHVTVVERFNEFKTVDLTRDVSHS